MHSRPVVLSGGHMEGVRGMTSAMAVVYRYCISPGQMATLHQELEMAQHFFDIITLRYKNRYTINIDVEEQLLKRPIPKMTLQPILENTFLHGMVGIESGGTVVIKGHVAADGATIISVSDNGHGIESKTMNNLNEELSDADVINFNKHGESRIGIHNVEGDLKNELNKLFKIKIENDLNIWKYIVHFHLVRNLLIHRDGQIDDYYMRKVKELGMEHNNFQVGDYILIKKNTFLDVIVIIQIYFEYILKKIENNINLDQKN